MNKTLKVMTSAALLAGVVAPVAVTTVDAQSINGVNKILHVDKDYGNVSYANAPLLSISEDGDFPTDFQNGSSDAFRLTLPSKVKWNFASSGVIYYDINGNIVSDSSVTGDLDTNVAGNDNLLFVGSDPATTTGVTAKVSFTKTNDQTLEVKIDSISGSKDILKFPLMVNIDGAEGDLKVKVDARDSALTSQEVTFANTGSGDTITTIADTTTIKETGAVIKTIQVDESQLGAMDDDGYQYAEFKLPTHYAFGDTGTIRFAGGFAGNVVGIKDKNNNTLLTTSDSITINSGNVGKFIENDGRTLKFYFQLNDPRTARGTIYISGLTVTPDSDASFTDSVELDVKGTNITSDTLNIGKYADYGVTVKNVDDKEAPELFAGRWDNEKEDVETVKLLVKETIENSLIDRKTIVKFPDYVKVRDVKVTKDKNATITDNADGTDNEVELRVTPTGGKVEFELQFELSIKADAPAGDIVAKFSGKSGIEGDFVVAKVLAPVAAQATAADVEVGIKDQKVGEITLTEPKREAIKKGELTITLPNNIEWNDVPTVKVEEGNIEIGDVTIDDETLTIEVDSESTVASKIVISGGSIDLDRTIAEGAVKAKVGGTSIVENHKTQNNDEDIDANEFDKDYVTEVKVATVKTPAPGKVSAEKVVFTIGSTSYTVGDVTKEMTVAPFVEAGRTYMPIRYVAEAVGADSILWDQATQTATVMKGDRIAQLTAGSKVLKVNGASITMDATAQVKDGRTVLPVRFVGQALGATVDWNEADQTVTVK